MIYTYNNSDSFAKIRWEMGLSSYPKYKQHPKKHSNVNHILKHVNKNKYTKVQPIDHYFSQQNLIQIDGIARSLFKTLFAPEKYDHCPITHEDFWDEIRCQLGIRILYKNFTTTISELVWNPISLRPIIYVNRNISFTIQSLAIAHQLGHLILQFQWYPHKEHLYYIKTDQHYIMMKCSRSEIKLNPNKIGYCKHIANELIANYFAQQMIIPLLCQDAKNNPNNAKSDLALLKTA